jgi:hypothetical protein
MSDAASLAQNLARNCGYAVFPCGKRKVPAIPGPGGYKHASKDPDEIAQLWRKWPGPLVGVATGAVSGISVLDVDQKHHEAWEWWQRNYHRLLPTRTYGTRSGGLHLYFRHLDGVICTTGRICKGVDTRGDGGYAVHWFAAGFACHDHEPPAPWPPWLLAALLAALKTPRPVETHHTGPPPAEVAIAGIVRSVATAAEGKRNAVLFWAACRLFERGVHQAEAERLLLPAAAAAGHTSAIEKKEDRRSISSAYRGRAVA